MWRARWSGAAADADGETGRRRDGGERRDGGGHRSHLGQIRGHSAAEGVEDEPGKERMSPFGNTLYRLRAIWRLFRRKTQMG